MAIDKYFRFPPRQGLAFFSNENKSYKFGTKFWLAACVFATVLHSAG
jgi:hypothetical protein